jgi:hypothetical protein
MHSHEDDPVRCAPFIGPANTENGNGLRDTGEGVTGAENPHQAYASLPTGAPDERPPQRGGRSS